MRKQIFALTFCALVIACAQIQPSMLAPADIALTDAEREIVAAGQHPESWFVGRLNGPREVIDGQTLNAKEQYLLEQSRAAQTPDSAEREKAAFATPEGRAAIRAGVDRRWRIHTQITRDMASVEDKHIPGRGGPIPVRIYRPAVSDKGPLPVLVYFHGGGFVFASVEAMDRAVRLIANEARVIVVSVDYRLAPEHAYPAAHDDAEDAFAWTRDNAASFGGDPARVGAGGDSAGGHLATVTALRRIEGGKAPPVQLLLYYPALTMAQTDPSYALFGNGYGLDLSFINLVTDLEFPDRSTRTSPFVSPIDAPNLSALPPAIVVTAGFDPLRDQGRRFAEKLTAAGVRATYRNYAGLTHSFLNWSGSIEDARTAAVETARFFADAIRAAPPR